jgi:mRNA-degrading endonuclease RelE of RelBE toxin-antitoxin system
MEKSSIGFRKSVARDLRRLSKKEVAVILDRIDGLVSGAGEPSAGLDGSNRYRLRAGAHHIVYEIVDGRIIITRVS